MQRGCQQNDSLADGYSHQMQKLPFDCGGKLGSVHSHVLSQASATNVCPPRPDVDVHAVPGRAAGAGAVVVALWLADPSSAQLRSPWRRQVRAYIESSTLAPHRPH